MRELIACWQSTRMIVLIGLIAALYTAVVFAFKWLPIIPGLTEIRPGASLPIVFSIFFGPAAAWGSAFGNITGDLLGGTIGPGSLFGMFGNFLYGYAPYRIVRAYSGKDENVTSGKGLAVLIFAILIASAACSFVISLGVHFLGLIQFDFLAHAILINNVVMSVILAPLLIRGLQKRIQQMKLLYTQILDPQQISSPLIGKAGAIIFLILLAAAYLAMMIPGLVPAVANPKMFALAIDVILVLAALVLL